MTDCQPLRCREPILSFRDYPTQDYTTQEASWQTGWYRTMGWSRAVLVASRLLATRLLSLRVHPWGPAPWMYSQGIALTEVSGSSRGGQPYRSPTLGFIRLVELPLHKQLEIVYNVCVMVFRLRPGALRLRRSCMAPTVKDVARLADVSTTRAGRRRCLHTMLSWGQRSRASVSDPPFG